MSDQTDVMDKGDKLMAVLGLTADWGPDGLIEVTGDKAPKNLGKGSGAHLFKFSLTDNTNANVTFRAEPDFLGIDESSTPPDNPGIKTDQVPTDSVKRPTPTTAQFKDTNKRACTLAYTLFFDANGASVTPFDPVIINGGG